MSLEVPDIVRVSGSKSVGFKGRFDLIPRDVEGRAHILEGYDPLAGFRAMTTSIAFRCGTPPEWEMNSPCPESKISQSQ